MKTYRQKPEVLVRDCLEDGLLAEVSHLGDTEAGGHAAICEHGVHRLDLPGEP